MAITANEMAGLSHWLTATGGPSFILRPRDTGNYLIVITLLQNDSGPSGGAWNLLAGTGVPPAPQATQPATTAYFGPAYEFSPTADYTTVTIALGLFIPVGTSYWIDLLLSSSDIVNIAGVTAWAIEV